MLLAEERAAVVEYGKKLLESELTTGTGGNLSVYNRGQGLIAIKPSSVNYLTMKAEDVVVMTPAGEVVEGKLRPSSEYRFHLALLNTRADINAVVHTHQVYATTIACLNEELPAVHYLIGFAGSKVPLAPYATYGTQELSDNIVRSIGPYNACLMANHGLVTVGENIQAAFKTAEALELVARLYYQARCIGKPVILNDEQMEDVLRKFGWYSRPQ